MYDLFQLGILMSPIKVAQGTILALSFMSSQIDEDSSLVPEAIQGGTYGFNSSANVPAEGFQF